MITLADASSYFDRTPILDPDTGAKLFSGQVDPYDDSKRDSATAYRRVLSVAPGTAIPTKRAVRILGAVWLIGDSASDGWDAAHRQKYVLHPADEKFNVSRLSSYLTATTTLTVWGDAEWVKDGKQIESTSSTAPIYSIYMPKGTSILEHDIVWSATRAFIVSAVRLQPSGIVASLGELLDAAVDTATISSRSYSPSTGSYTAATVTTAKCLKVRWQAMFNYDSQSDAKYQEGDCNLVFPLGTSITTSTTVVLSGKTWGILSVETLGGAVVAHGRPK